MKQYPFTRFSLFTLLLAGIITIVYSCKKDNGSTGDGSGYYMRFKINGTLVEYKAQVEGTFNKVTSLQHNTSLAGLKEALVANKNNMTLLLATDDDTQTGLSYTSYTTSAAGMQKARLAGLGYFDESGTNYLSWMEEFASALPPGTETKAVIKVTEAASGYIRGNFSGVMYNADYSKKLDVTEGEFYARRFN
jgi:hypothetical protein